MPLATSPSPSPPLLLLLILALLLPLPPLPAELLLLLHLSGCPREHLASFFGVNFTTPVHSFNCQSSHMQPPLSLSLTLSPSLLLCCRPCLSIYWSHFLSHAAPFSMSLCQLIVSCAKPESKVHMKILAIKKERKRKLSKNYRSR